MLFQVSCFLLAPETECHFPPVFQCQLQLISFCYSLITTTRFHLLICCTAHLKNCSWLLTRIYPPQPLLPSGFQDPTLSSAQLLKNVKSARSVKKSHPPPFAGPSFCSLLQLLCSVFNALKTTLSLVLFCYCHVCSCHESCLSALLRLTSYAWESQIY